MVISDLDKISIEYKYLNCIAFEHMEKEPIKVTDPVTGEVSDSFKIVDERYSPGRWIFDPKSGYFIEVKPALMPKIDRWANRVLSTMFPRRQLLDTTPVALPVGFVPPDPLEVRIARLLGQGEFQRFRQTADPLETLFDLDIPDDPVDPLAPSDEYGTDSRVADAFKTHQEEVQAMFEGRSPTPTPAPSTDNPGKSKGKVPASPKAAPENGELEV